MGVCNLHITCIHGGEKMWKSGSFFQGNVTIWWEILYFSIKKYIRNSGKCNYLPGKNTFFPDLHVYNKTIIHVLICLLHQALCPSLAMSPLVNLPDPLMHMGSHHMYDTTIFYALILQALCHISANKSSRPIVWGSVTCTSTCITN